MARKRKKPTWLIGFLILISGTIYIGSQQVDWSRIDWQQSSWSEIGQVVTESVGHWLPSESTASHQELPPERSTESITIASFNIQVFGQSKLAKSDVMQQLTTVVRNFDIVGIQEIRSKDQTLMPKFVEMLNAEGRHFDFIISPRIGRTSSKEQYAYVYDLETIEFVPDSAYLIYDPEDLLHREPLVASFRVRGPPEENPFQFTLINSHTDPDEVDQEVPALAEVYRFVEGNNIEEDDVILLGDLNVNENHLMDLSKIPDLTPAPHGQPTNTRGTKQYDHILVDAYDTQEFTGQAGVFNLMEYFQITTDQALEISDHLPVWAEFQTREKKAPVRMAGPSSDTIIR